MLKGFEQQTKPLSEMEKRAMELIRVAFIKWYVGEGNSVTAERIQKGMKIKYDIKIEPPRIRKVINYLRNNHLPNLVASSKGYYLETDKKKIKTYLDSLKGRVDAMSQVVKSMEKYLNVQDEQGNIVF